MRWLWRVGMFGKRAGTLTREGGVGPELVSYFGSEDGSTTGRIEQRY